MSKCVSGRFYFLSSRFEIRKVHPIYLIPQRRTILRNGLIIPIIGRGGTRPSSAKSLPASIFIFSEYLVSVMTSSTEILSGTE